MVQLLMTHSGGAFSNLAVSYRVLNVNLARQITNRGEQVLQYYNSPYHGQPQRMTSGVAVNVTLSSAPQNVSCIEMCTSDAPSTNHSPSFSADLRRRLPAETTLSGLRHHLPATNVLSVPDSGCSRAESQCQRTLLCENFGLGEFINGLVFVARSCALPRTFVSTRCQSQKLYYSFAEVPADVRNGGEAFFLSGNETGLLPLQIMDDELPELNEQFEVELTGVEAQLAPGEKLIASNAPTLGVRRWVMKFARHAIYSLP